MRYGILYQHHQAKYYYYEVLLLLKRLLVTALASFLGSFLGWQLSLVTAIYAVAMLLQGYWNPYLFRHHNRLEQFLNVCVLGVVNCGMLLQNGERSRSNSVVLAVAILAFLAAALAVGAFVLFLELRHVQEMGEDGMDRWKRENRNVVGADSYAQHVGDVDEDISLSTFDVFETHSCACESEGEEVVVAEKQL